MDGALQELATVLAAATAENLPGDAALEALPSIVGLREQLDRCELMLIESARASGASWTRVAEALGLGSRQAAEQRFLRLSGQSTRDTRDAGAARAARRGQRSVDAVYGTGITGLRSAVRRALARMALDPAWDKRFARAALCRNSLAMAADAQPGALFALTEHVLVDLAAAPAGEPVVEEVRRRLARAMSR
jgi:hypothetical protein